MASFIYSYELHMLHQQVAGAVQQKYSYWDSWYKEFIISFVILNMYIKAPD